MYQENKNKDQKKRNEEKQEEKTVNQEKSVTKEIFWQIPEFNYYERSKRWYIFAGITVLAFLSYAFFTSNFLFAVIIVIISFILISHHNVRPPQINVMISDDGVFVGNRQYDFSLFANFAIVYKPKEDIRNLYFEFRNAMRPPMSIPLLDMNPLLIRAFLLKYLDEDLDREDQSVSENLARILKI